MIKGQHTRKNNVSVQIIPDYFNIKLRQKTKTKQYIQTGARREITSRSV